MMLPAYARLEGIFGAIVSSRAIALAEAQD